MSTMFAMPTKKKSTRSSATKSSAKTASTPRKVKSAGAKPTSRPLEGSVALVTGGSRGIGLAIARSLAARGASVVVTGRDEAAMTAAVASITNSGGVAVSRHCDVSNPESVAGLFTAIKKQFRKLDIVVNNAGVAGPTAKVEQLSLDAWREVLDVNLTGTFLVTRAALALMKPGGIIVNNLSIAAKGAFPGMSAYTAAKHGALGFTQTLREELRERGIRVVALVAGATNTAIWEQFWPEAPRQSMMSPETVAEAVAHAVCLPENASIDELVIAPAVGRL